MTALLLPPPLSAVAVVEFIAGRRTLNTVQQGQLRAELPVMWAVYFADYDTVVRLSTEKLAAR